MSAKKFTLALIFWTVLFSAAMAQTLPQDLDYSYRSEVLLDAGCLWNFNSIYHPFEIGRQRYFKKEAKDLAAFSWLNDYIYEYINKSNQSPDTSKIGLNLILLSGICMCQSWRSEDKFGRTAFQPYICTSAYFRNNWYSTVYLRAANDEKTVPHYSAVPREISRLGLNSGEVDQAVIGYKNDWARVEFGRSREIWGPMTENNLVLSGYSPPYERLAAQLSLGKFKFRYFYGFMETVIDEDFINRYITGRSIQYSNNKNFILGVSEVSVLAGPYRAIDWAFLNPLSTHLENDLNEHTLSDSANYNNAIWAVYCDWMCHSNLRISGSLAIDELKLEWQERAQGEPDVMGYLAHISWTPYRNPIGLTLIVNYTRLDTYFGQHIYKYANFVNRDEFLGHSIGNDADKISAALRLVFKCSTLTELEFGRYRWGSNSLLENPYHTFTQCVTLPFPSGEKTEIRYLALKLNSQFIRNLSVTFMGQINISRHPEVNPYQLWELNLRYQLPIYLIKL